MNNFFFTPRSGTPRLRGILGLVLAFGGCYQGTDAAKNGGGGGEGSEVGDDVEALELPAPTTRFFRLTHDQWENTVQDLFYLAAPTGFATSFRDDPQEGGYLFENSALGLAVDQTLWNGYRGAAIQVAELVTADASVLEAIVPSGQDDEVRADAFIREFGTRAFRRPLTEDEATAYRALFESAASLYVDVPAFEAGVRVTIESMLQSPFFVYRIEDSDEVGDDGVIPLSGHEIAARLSYTLWNTMPDDELLRAAETGELDTAEGVAAQAVRLLESPRAHAVVLAFHDAVFQARKFESVRPSATFFPNAPADLGALALEEFHRFVRDAVYAGDGGLFELLTLDQSYVNDDLAKIYGIGGTFGDEFVLAQLPPGQRRGFLTQVGFLAGNATSVNPDPIHRGKLILERVTCASVPPPPDNVPPLPAVDGQTNRQAIEDLTEQPGSNCAGCHATFINPYGFPFEHYDAIGAFRETDNGFPVDPASTIRLDGGALEVGNPFEVIDALARSPSVHACYVKHWLEYVHGRTERPEDEAIVDRLSDRSLTEHVSLKELLVELVSSTSFRTRAAEELE